VGLKGYQQNLWISGILYLAAFGGLSFFMMKIRGQLDSEIILNDTIREKSFRSLGLVEERFRKEDQKIQEFHGKVENITHLFELAKDFNTCLSFQDLLGMIRDTVFRSLPCRRLRILVLRSFLTDSPRGFQIQDQEIKPWLAAESLPDDLFQSLLILGGFQKFDSGSDSNLPCFFEKEKQELHYPLWVFPLKIEGSTVAFLIVEAAQEKDFYRYQIVAGELALQIQKTLLYERVHALSLYDGLTQVYVRRHLEERLEEELRRARTHGLQLSVLMVDVDHFKSYNDSYGHLVGDRILKEIADSIRDEIRTVDLVGRFGGEEFILIFPETSRKGSFEAAERIRSAVAKKKFKVYDEEIRATLSIGVATFPDCLGEKGKGEFSPAWKDALIEMADAALYQAKEDGRNQVKLAGKVGKEGF
jgi:diguanylate cyclase (GGDEF)-like protein